MRKYFFVEKTENDGRNLWLRIEDECFTFSHLLHGLLQNFQHTSILFQFCKFSGHLHVCFLLGWNLNWHSTDKQEFITLNWLLLNRLSTVSGLSFVYWGCERCLALPPWRQKDVRSWALPQLVWFADSLPFLITILVSVQKLPPGILSHLKLFP